LVERVIGTILAPLPMLAWVLWRAAEGERRWEYLLFLVVAPALAWTGPRTRKFFWGLYPFAILGLVYDAMRFVKNVGVSPSRLHICDLRALDSRWFGFADGTTLHDWLQTHSVPILDVVCAIPYGTFLEVAIAFAIYLYVKDYEAMKRFGWTFLLVNLCGFVTYHVYPAAPPWYFHAHGCVADLTAHASEGPNLARVDGWLGFGYFHGFYGRSSDVFGAVPSLHVAYPLLILLFGWPIFRVAGRTLAVLFFATMCFAAVYLDHHWVIDVLMGISYTLFVHRVVHEVLALHGHREAHPRAPKPAAPVGTRNRVAFTLATWFGCGYTPFAPGTAGTLGAIPLYLIVRPFGAGAVLAAAIAITAVGVWASSVVVTETGLKDPQIVVIDEVAGVLLVLAASPFTWMATIAAVVAFRVLDQLKPWPAYVAERVLPSGWGVMFDDVFAGVWGAAAITLLAGMGAL
jgi:phosphatidylglycerophosphatase A